MRPKFQFAAIILILASIMGACATLGGKEPSPKESLLAVLDRLGVAIAGKNPDAVNELLSPNFYHPEIGHRGDAYTMMILTVDSGFSGGFVLDYSTVECDIDTKNGRAHLYPLILKGDQREFRLGLDMAQRPEDGAWQILTFQLD